MPNRQRQISLLVALGLSNKEIATSLGISAGTIKVYITKMFDRYGIKSRLDLAIRTMTLDRPFAASVEEDAIRAAVSGISAA